MSKLALGINIVWLTSCIFIMYIHLNLKIRTFYLKIPISGFSRKSEKVPLLQGYPQGRRALTEPGCCLSPAAPLSPAQSFKTPGLVLAECLRG